MGIIFAIGALFGASIIYFISMHRAGTAGYAAKTVVIGLLTVPVAILLTLASASYVVTMAARKSLRVVGAVSRRIFGFKPTEDTCDDDPADTAEVTVHLVHGTFERRAPWTLPGSEMRKAIEGIKHKVKIARFSWSGKNSPAARSRAAQALAQKLKASPSRRHYIVAHSHGGNIVREMSHLYPEIASKIHGVCLLSTPFIFRREINRTAGNFIYLNSIGFIFATLIPVTAATLLFRFNAYLPDALIIASIIAFIVELVLSKYCRRSYAQELKVANEMMDLRDVQIYHAIGDEADSGLRFVSFLHEACFGVLSQLKAAAKLAKSKFHWPYVAAYVFFICTIGYVAFFPSVSKIWMAVNLIGLGVTIAVHVMQRFHSSTDDPPVLVAAALPIVTFSFWLAAAKAIAFGDWRLIFCPEILVSSSETPAGPHQVLKFAPQTDGTMVHSTHSHPEAVLNVASWLDSRLDAEEAGDARNKKPHAISQNIA
ncbi:lipase family protein [Paraburkholderia caballeronis]|nr:hypothetical protein [Paraburkholderia caballeronis]